MSTPVSRHTRRRAPTERPQEILQAALEEFTLRGFQAARLEDVAKRAGCSKAAIYLYYADKTALFEAVVRRWLVSEVDGARALIAAHHGPVAEVLRGLAIRIVTLVSEPPIPDIIRLVIAESRAFPHLAKFWHDAVIAQMLPLLTDVVARGISTGEFRSVDAGFAVRSLVGPIVFASLWRSVFEPVGAEPLDVAGFIAAHTDFVLTGLAVATPPPSGLPPGPPLP